VPIAMAVHREAPPELHSLLDKAQEAVTGKAADEKAFADGKEALSKKRFGTAVEKLALAANF